MTAACLDDATLDDFVHARLPDDARARAEAHVDACADCSAIVSVLAGGRLDAEPSPSALLPKGTAVGRHVIVEPRGSGAMGVVYLAYDPELDRRVALKLLRPGGAPERMLREAQAMARVAHPNVVAIHDVGRVGGAVYLAMEYVDGSTLREWCRPEAGRPWSEVCRAFVQAGHGLAAAHEAGLVHRDFKPENVLVGTDGRVRVTDFGLARLGADDAREAPPPDRPIAAPLLTRTGALLGTPRYMAPELFAGGEATAASDQFAFGVSLHEAAYGTRPFRGQTIAELRAAIERGPSPPAEGRAPSAVRLVILRALAARPEDRYPSMNALLAELEERPPARSRLWIVATALAATASIALLATRHAPAPDPCAAGEGLGASLLDADRASRIRAAFVATGVPDAARTADRVLAALSGYRQQWVTAHRSTCEATAVRHEQSPALLDARMHCLARERDEAAALLAQLEHATPESEARADEAVASLPRAASCADVKSLASVDPLPAGDARARLARLDQALAVARAETAAGAAPADTLATAARLVAEAEAIGYRPAIAETKLFHGTLLRRTGALLGARSALDDALVAAEAAHDDRAAALTWLELLALRNEEGSSPAALAARAPVTAALARLGDPPELHSSMLFELGVAETNQGDLEGATRDLEACLAARERALGKTDFDVSRALTALGNLARVKNDLPGAHALHERALAIDTELLGPLHPALARHHHNIGGLLRLEGKLDLALASYERALDLETKGLGPRHRSVGRTENSLGLVYLGKGELRAARAHLDRALDILGTHPDRALALHNLGLVDAGEGRHADAIRRYDEAIAIVRAARGDADESIARLQASRAASEKATAKPPRRPVAKPAQVTGSYGPAETFDHERH